MRWMITNAGGTLAAFMISPYGPLVSKNRRTVSDAYSGVIVTTSSSQHELVEVAEVVLDLARR